MSKRRLEIDADYMAYLEGVAAREGMTVIALIHMSVSERLVRRAAREDSISVDDQGPTYVTTTKAARLPRPLTRRGGNDEA